MSHRTDPLPVDVSLTGLVAPTVRFADMDRAARAQGATITLRPATPPWPAIARVRTNSTLPTTYRPALPPVEPAQ